MTATPRPGPLAPVTPVITKVDTPAPSFDGIGSPAGMGGTVFYLAPLGAPAGAHDLERRVYGTAGAGGRPLDLWVHRRTDASERRPGVVFVHGGGWGGGGPQFHLRHAHELAGRGFVTATTSYRWSGDAPGPACLEDAKCALRWMRANADELGLDPDRIAVAGGSAGGHLAALVALTPQRWEGDGGNADVSSAPDAAVLWYPPTEMGLLVEVGAEMVAALRPGYDDAVLEEISPLTHVSPAAPPVLTLTGDDDPIAPIPALERFHEALGAAGVPSELVIYAGREHGFDFHPTDWQDCTDRMVAFLETHL